MQALDLRVNLGDDYEIRSMPEDEFFPLFRKYCKEIFDDETSVFRLRDILTENEKEKIKKLDERMGSPLELCLGLFKANEFIGWHYGRQESATTFYMQNSAILPKYRRQGLYSKLLDVVISHVIDYGFQSIYSRHNITNNAVIIPKLKAGFLITNIELSDIFGTLVHLTYYSSPLRKKVLDYRAGQIKMDSEIKKLLGE